MYFFVARNVPSIFFVHHVVDDPTSVLTLICVTKTAPPTEITWQKDGMNIADDDVTLKTLSVTDRNSSTYVSTISIRTDNVLNHIATYTVIVGNSHGSVKENHTVEGMTVLSNIECITNGYLIHYIFQESKSLLVKVKSSTVNITVT